MDCLRKIISCMFEMSGFVLAKVFKLKSRINIRYWLKVSLNMVSLLQVFTVAKSQRSRETKSQVC